MNSNHHIPTTTNNTQPIDIPYQSLPSYDYVYHSPQMIDSQPQINFNSTAGYPQPPQYTLPPYSPQYTQQYTQPQYTSPQYTSPQYTSPQYTQQYTPQYSYTEDHHHNRHHHDNHHDNHHNNHRHRDPIEDCCCTII